VFAWHSNQLRSGVCACGFTEEEGFDVLAHIESPPADLARRESAPAGEVFDGACRHVQELGDLAGGQHVGGGEGAVRRLSPVGQASGCRGRRARPLTFCASAISTSQPCRSSVSWTRRAPVIDSITAQTG
jgi:hypothetical protein